MTQTTYTDNVVIEGSQDIAQLRIQGNATQTEPLLALEDNASSLLGQFTGDGRLEMGNHLDGGAPHDATIQANSDIDDSSVPTSIWHTLGRITDQFGAAVSWVVHELQLLGSEGISGLHTALRVKLTHSNTGDASAAELRAVDIIAANEGGDSETSVEHLTGIRSTVSNAADAFLDKAVGVEAAIVNEGTINQATAIQVVPPINDDTIDTLVGLDIPDLTQGTTNVAIRTGLGPVQFGDSLEVTLTNSAPAETDLRAARITSVNEAGDETTPVSQITGVRAEANNAADAFLDKAVGVEAAIVNEGNINQATAIQVLPTTNDGTIDTLIGLDIPDLTEGSTNFAIRTGQGPIHLGDAVEIALQESTPTTTPDEGFIEVYPRTVFGKPRLFAKTSGGQEVSLGSSEVQAGSTFPTYPPDGTLFYHTDRKQMYRYEAASETWWGGVISMPFAPLQDSAPMDIAGRYRVQLPPLQLALQSLSFNIQVASTNDGSDYWTIDLKSDDTVYATVDTSDDSPDTLTLKTIDGFTLWLIAPPVTLYLEATAVGTPGDLYLDVPQLQGVEAELPTTSSSWLTLDPALQAQNANLRLWLRANTLQLEQDEAVTAWNDSSGNGIDVAQSDPDYQPTFSTGIINGLPAVTFSGNQRLRADTTSGKAILGNDPRTIFVVGEFENGDGLFINLGNQYSERELFGITANKLRTWAFDPEWNSPDNLTQNEFKLFSFVYDPGTGNINVWENGVQVVTDLSIDPLDTTDATYWIGGRDVDELFLEGFIAEMAVYSATLDATERAAVEAILMNKYGLS